MQIVINTENPLSETDKAALRALIGDSVETPVSAPAAATPAKAAKKAAPKAEKAAPEPEPEAEPEGNDNAGDDATDDGEDLVGGDGPTMEDAVALATKLVSSGQAAKVKAALSEVGAKKVSEVKDEDIATFVNALS